MYTLPRSVVSGNSNPYETTADTEEWVRGVENVYVGRSGYSWCPRCDIGVSETQRGTHIRGLYERRGELEAPVTLPHAEGQAGRQS